jgi:DNA modification methylase
MNNPLRVLFASFDFVETSPPDSSVIIYVFSKVSFAFWQMNNPLRVLFASFDFVETSPPDSSVIIYVFSKVSFALGKTN